MSKRQSIISVHSVPGELMNSVDREILERIGFRGQEDVDGWKLYAEISPLGEIDLDVERLQSLLSSIRKEYPKNGFYPSWVEDLEEVLENTEASMEAVGEKYALISVPEWESIFMGILQKPENSGEQRIDSIAFKFSSWTEESHLHDSVDFEGVTWTERVWLYDADFYVVRITPNGVQKISSGDIVAFMERGGEIDPSGKLTSMPEQEKTERKPQILNAPKPGDRTYEAIVTRDTTESAVVRVFAEDEQEAATIMTDRGHASKAVFEVDEGNPVDEYYLGDPDAIEDVSGFVPF
ncbi:hypothetical protein [Thioalkalivibrio sp. ALE23]|uniref:hypothetical protein n=1 Tax=Thioalkalivibrio sp. ALE23 TaxID=1265495 RepID=UPI00037F23B4|nr:hypothetical protein [Thioalkalivibrio sp. ALE23]